MPPQVIDERLKELLALQAQQHAELQPMTDLIQHVQSGQCLDLLLAVSALLFLDTSKPRSAAVNAAWFMQPPMTVHWGKCICSSVCSSPSPVGRGPANNMAPLQNQATVKATDPSIIFRAAVIPATCTAPPNVHTVVVLAITTKFTCFVRESKQRTGQCYCNCPELCQPTLSIPVAAVFASHTESPEALTPWFYSYQAEFLRLVKFTDH